MYGSHEELQLRGKKNVSRPCVNRNTNLTSFKKGSLNIMPKFPLYVGS